MPQKFGQIAQPDLIRFMSATLRRARFFAVSVAAAIVEK
jgi:hypothetical protein